MKFSSAAITLATLSIASAQVGTKSTKSSNGKSTKTNKSSKSSPTAAPVTASPTKEPITSSPTGAPVTPSPTLSPTSAPVLFPTTSPVQTCDQSTCSNCCGRNCKSNADCCGNNSGETCETKKPVCYYSDFYNPGLKFNCSKTCDDQSNRTLVLEQCVFPGIPDDEIDCTELGIDEFCMPSTAEDGECVRQFCRRRLHEGEAPVSTDVPLKRRLEIIESMGAKPDATFSFMYDLISKESCDTLVKHLEDSLQRKAESGDDLPTGESAAKEGRHESWVPFEEGGIDNQFNHKLTAKQIVKLIGAEETMKLIDYFEKSFGKLTIDCMYIARHGDPGDDVFNVPWHMDDYDTMEITLNDDYDGGEVLHLNADGVHKTEARPGSVTAHTTDIVHGITPNKNGAKYMLILKHHYNRPDKVGVIRLSKELVEEAVANLKESK